MSAFTSAFDASFHSQDTTAAAYVSEAELKETKELRGTNYADLDLRLAIGAASRAIDDLTDRRFYSDSDATQVRYYTPRSPGRVYIDDLITLTTFKVDRGGDGTFEETWAVNTDFLLEPLNAAADGRPWEYATAHPYGTRAEFPVGVPRSVQVTGQFGWAAVPMQIKQATVILTSRLMMRAREAPLGVVAIGLDAAIRLAKVDPDVMALVHDLRRTDPLIA